MRITPRRRRITIGAVVLLAMVGCSQLPTAPKPDLASLSSETPRATTSVPLNHDDGGPSQAPSAESVSATVPINGLLGGVVVAGDIKVVIPPTAIRGNVLVTVTQPDPNSLRCDLSVSPPSANRFLLPVMLVVDGSSLPNDVLSVSTIQWFNPQTQKWQDVPGASVDLLDLTVQAPLWHFSQYRVDGRAGW